VHDGVPATIQAPIPASDVVVTEVRTTVWADAADPAEALGALLDGALVYDSEDLALRVTGRRPVEVLIVARRRP
jgi:hypothetical protein